MASKETKESETSKKQSEDEIQRKDAAKLKNFKQDRHPPTSYIETMVNLLKGNIGTGCFALPEAIKHGGIILGPIFILIIAFIAVLAQHMLIRCAEFVKERHQLHLRPDYAETVELSCLNSNSERWRKLAPTMKKTCNIFICITQLGFCCVYLLFVGKSLKDVSDYYEIMFDLHLWVFIALIPVWFTVMIRTLKIIGEFKLSSKTSNFSLTCF
jgi:solute carrier family 36 (proton-coupled amino acid transporter)